MYTRHFYIWSNYYGAAEEHKRIIHAELHEPQHYAMFCPECGEVWARMPVDGVGTPNWWRIIGGNCERHPPTSRYVVGGSLILNWEQELTDLLPEAVLRRELELHLKLVEQA